MNSLYCFCQLSGAHICVPAEGGDIVGAAKASAAFNPCGYALDADVVACVLYISSTVAACTAADGEETDAASAPVTSAAQRSLVMSEMPRPRTLSAMVFRRIWIWPELLGRPYNRTATYLVHFAPYRGARESRRKTRLVGCPYRWPQLWHRRMLAHDKRADAAPPSRNRWFVDSRLEGGGFEPSVPQRCCRRFEASRSTFSGPTFLKESERIL